MTARTPPLTNRPTHGGFNPENSNAHFNNEVNSPSRNQSENGNCKNTSTTAVENRPVNRGYRPPQSDNFGALFGVEYYHYPVNKREDKKENKNKETKDWGYKGKSVREVDAGMAYDRSKFEELEWRNKLHSAKIHDLERELKNVRMENNTIRGQYDQGPSPRNAQQYGQNGMQSLQRGNDSDFDPYQQNKANPGYPGAKGMNQHTAEEPKTKREYKNDQYNWAHHRGEKDGEVYWGFNKYYNPQYSTSYRRENLSYVTRQEEQSQQQSGGLYIMRFHVSGTKTARTSLDLQQSIIHSSGGRVLGKSGKYKVIILEGDADWRRTKSDEAKVEDTVIVIWFPTKTKAFEFASNAFRNGFKDHGFPTPHGSEGHYIPLMSPMLFSSLDTVLIVELLNAGRYEKAKRDRFLTGAYEAVLNMIPNSLPFVSSAYEDKVAYRPGPLFKDRSAVYISMFSSVGDACDAWRRVISRSLSENGITGPVNVSAFSLIDYRNDED